MANSREVKTLDDLRRHGEYGVALGTVPGYLFQTKTGESPFLETQKEFAQLNDYLCGLRELEEWHEGRLKVGHGDGPIRDNALRYAQSITSGEEHDISEQLADFFLQEMSFSLKESIKLLNAASGLLLIYFLLIRTLKTIVLSADFRSAQKTLDALGLDGSPRRIEYLDVDKERYAIRWQEYRRIISRAEEYRQRRGESELKKYIRLLESNCGIEIGSDIASNGEFQAQIDFVRRIRNDFSHGDWGKLESLLIRVSAKEAFYQIKWLLSKIEERYPGPVLLRSL